MTRAEAEASVRACDARWSESYYDDYYGDAAPYLPVQRELIRRLLVEAAARRVLDAGCGPAFPLQLPQRQDLSRGVRALIMGLPRSMYWRTRLVAWLDDGRTL